MDSFFGKEKNIDYVAKEFGGQPAPQPPPADGQVPYPGTGGR